MENTALHMENTALHMENIALLVTCVTFYIDKIAKKNYV